MRIQLQRLRPWLTVVALVLMAAVLLPPGATAARQYVFAEAAQFAVLAMVAPALIVLGAPWRLRLRGQATAAGRLADRIAAARSRRPGESRAWLTMVGFAVIAIAWRLPLSVNALVRHPALVVAEAVTLIVAGCALWLELVESPPLLPRASRPQRAACAAVPMWAIWADAYIMGFSRATYYSAFPHLGRGLGMIADQEIAAFVLLVSFGLCSVPVVFGSLVIWMRDLASLGNDLREVPGAGDPASGGSLRPPKGWRPPSPRQQEASR